LLSVNLQNEDPAKRAGAGKAMVRLRFLALAAMAAFALASCTTGSVDGTETTAITPQFTDVSAADLGEGKQQFRASNYGLAEKHFRKAVELRADNAEAWMGLAASYDQLGRFDFSDRAYEQLLKLTGRKPQVVNNMGYSQYLRGNKKKAKQLLLEAKKGMADTTVVDANLAMLKKG
jgi:Flp pilus assembly protein TadD